MFQEYFFGPQAISYGTHKFYIILQSIQTLSYTIYISYTMVCRVMLLMMCARTKLRSFGLGVFGYIQTTHITFKSTCCTQHINKITIEQQCYLQVAVHNIYKELTSQFRKQLREFFSLFFCKINNEANLKELGESLNSHIEELLQYEHLITANHNL